MTTDLQAMLRAEAIKLADNIYEMVIRQVTSAISGAPVSAPAPEPVRPSRVPPAPPAPTAKKRRRLAQSEVEDTLASIIELLKRKGEMRSEAIRAELGIDKKLFQHAAYVGKNSDQLVQSGERRSTVYTLPVTASRSTAPSKAQENGRVVRRKKRAAA